MVAAVAIDEVSVKVVLVGKVGYNLPQGFLAVGIENMVYKLYDGFGYLIIKDDCRCSNVTFIIGGFMTCAIADAGRVRHHADITSAFSDF